MQRVNSDPCSKRTLLGEEKGMLKHFKNENYKLSNKKYILLLCVFHYWTKCILSIKMFILSLVQNNLLIYGMTLHIFFSYKRNKQQGEIPYAKSSELTEREKKNTERELEGCIQNLQRK